MVRQYYKVENYEARKSVGYLIRNARNLITAQIEEVFAERFAEKGITFVQYVVMMCLRDNLAKTCSEIANYISYDSGAFTRLIDQLEMQRLVERQRSTEDRRVVELHLTGKGHAMVESLIAPLVALYNEMLTDFTRDEADTLIRLLTKFIGVLSDTPLPSLKKKRS